MERYVIRGGREGAGRLEILADADRPAISAFWDRTGVGPGLACLDLGCGPGIVTIDLARRVGPTGRVVAVDRDKAAIDAARERLAAAGLDNVEFVVSDVYEFEATAGFDFVFSRLLLHHVSRPGDILRTMWDAVRPGGVVAVNDADFEAAFCYPRTDAFDFWIDRYSKVLRHFGGDPVLGRTLVRRFLDAGLPTPDVRISQRVLRDVPGKLLPMLTVAETADAMLDAGVATRDEVDAAVAGLQAVADDPGTICAGPRLFEVWARKPGTPIED
jgi:SAM-dependent methyltransferase